ncbi:hypothetical protein NX801_14165 [Streptomyces sp. LP05-1]|uniref:Uncharacterized protein n=1 Tax=Streptomyces pyxinae TaxID=2970734 RepID=A0ABT2CJM0_9ACTN|nr:hypothetical protein [Streptomyces sp. LP05-1]MCS0636784.1 hypothetical protein [Streptomyces sp. LP05-1]
MEYAVRGDAPIYDTLIEERGDVPADVRQVAEETIRRMSLAMDFSSVRGRPSGPPGPGLPRRPGT